MVLATAVMLGSAIVMTAFSVRTFSMSAFRMGGVGMLTFRGSVLLLVRGFRSRFTMLGAGHKLGVFDSRMVSATMLFMRARPAEEQSQSQQHDTYRQKDEYLRSRLRSEYVLFVFYYYLMMRHCLIVGRYTSFCL